MTTHTVAVYGTLRKDQSNSRLMRTAKFVSVSHIEGFSLWDNGSYPYALPSEDTDDNGHPVKIEVEVYEVDDATLATLDMLEGYEPDSPYNHYNRHTLRTMTGQDVLAYIPAPGRHARIEDTCVHIGQSWRWRYWIADAKANAAAALRV